MTKERYRQRALEAKVTNLGSRLGEKIDDRVAGLLRAGEGVSISYDDATNKITITATVALDESQVGAIADDAAKSRILSMFAPGDGITITYNEGDDSLTISAQLDVEAVDGRIIDMIKGGPNVTVSHDSVTNHLTISAANSTDPEAIAAILQEGNNIQIYYDEISEEITIASTLDPGSVTAISRWDTLDASIWDAL